MSQSAQDVATLQSQACRISSALDAAGIPGGVDLHQRVMVAVVRMQTAEEQRTQKHRQVAEIAAVLDPEVCADAWGCHEAAQKRMRELSALQSRVTMLETSVRQQDEQRMATEEALHTVGLSVDDGLHEAVLAIIRERNALKTELAETKRDLYAELRGSDAAHRLLTELGVEKTSGPDETPPGTVLSVTERIRRLDAKHARRMLGAKQAVDAVRELQTRTETERNTLRTLAEEVLAAHDACRQAMPGEVEQATAERDVALEDLRNALSAPTAEAPPATNSPEIPDSSPKDTP